MNTRCKLSVCFFLCLLLMLLGSALAASGQYEVTAGKLNFREEASSDGRTITALSRGTVVTVLDASGDWAEARWNGKTGYLSLEYLDKVSGAATGGKNTTKLSGEAWLKKSAVLYQSADTDSDELISLPKGEKLSLRGETVNFYYVKADGKTGYVLKSRVTAEEQDAPAKEKDEEREEKASSDSGSSSGVLKRGAQGERVEELQRRLCTLGYLRESYVTGYFGGLTEEAVARFQKDAGLDDDGVAGSKTLKKLDSAKAPSQKKVVEMDWYETNVSSLVKKRGGTAYIIDVKTGTRINIRRVGGSNHMDVEPAKAKDTEKLLDLYGGSWSWDQRAVVLVAGGKHIAASINGMPHGDEISRSNNFDGHFCLHTTNSRTHGTDKVNGRHQKRIQEALDAY